MTSPHSTRGMAIAWAALSLIAAAAAEGFMGDEILVRGRELEITRRELDNAYDQFKANAALRNQEIPESRREELEAMLLDRLVVTRLLLNRATEEDRRQGKVQADQFVANVMKEAGSEASFQRQLLVLGFTREDFESQVLERAICEEVVERELKDKGAVSDVEVEAFYNANLEKFQRPEMVRASHILISTRNPDTQAELSDADKADKRALAAKVLEQIRAGADFAALVKQYSDDPGSKDKEGEYIFARGQMVPGFEAAAFSLEEGKVSDIVQTQYGFHIIKLLQRIPPETIQLEKVKDEVRQQLRQKSIQETYLPAHLKQVKEWASLVYTNGARPPAQSATGLP